LLKNIKDLADWIIKKEIYNINPINIFMESRKRWDAIEGIQESFWGVEQSIGKFRKSVKYKNYERKS